jgi:hypothetical protein
VATGCSSDVKALSKISLRKPSPPASLNNSVVQFGHEPKVSFRDVLVI